MLFTLFIAMKKRFELCLTLGKKRLLAELKDSRQSANDVWKVLRSETSSIYDDTGNLE